MHILEAAVPNFKLNTLKSAGGFKDNLQVCVSNRACMRIFTTVHKHDCIYLP